MNERLGVRLRGVVFVHDVCAGQVMKLVRVGIVIVAVLLTACSSERGATEAEVVNDVRESMASFGTASRFQVVHVDADRAKTVLRESFDSEPQERVWVVRVSGKIQCPDDGAGPAGFVPCTSEVVVLRSLAARKASLPTVAVLPNWQGNFNRLGTVKTYS